MVLININFDLVDICVPLLNSLTEIVAKFQGKIIYHLKWKLKVILTITFHKSPRQSDEREIHDPSSLFYFLTKLRIESCTSQCFLMRLALPCPSGSSHPHFPKTAWLQYLDDYIYFCTFFFFFLKKNKNYVISIFFNLSYSLQTLLVLTRYKKHTSKYQEWTHPLYNAIFSAWYAWPGLPPP